jgi:hypothetical protein
MHRQISSGMRSYFSALTLSVESVAIHSCGDTSSPFLNKASVF